MKQGWAHSGILEMMEPQLDGDPGLQDVVVVTGGQDVVGGGELGGGELEPLPGPVDAEEAVVVVVGVALLPPGKVLDDDDPGWVAVATLSVRQRFDPVSAGTEHRGLKDIPVANIGGSFQSRGSSVSSARKHAVDRAALDGCRGLRVALACISV